MERKTAAPWGRTFKVAGPWVATFIAGMVLGPLAVYAVAAKPAPAIVGEIGEATSTGPVLTHAQDVWISALEWCESRGVETAVNPKDRDGTPSYYSFQFKPGTFTGFAKQYGITGTIDQYEAQRAIIENMILDPAITPYQWAHQQFPGCVKLLGLPPRG